MEYPLDEEAAKRLLANFAHRYRREHVKVDLVWMAPTQFLGECVSPVSTAISARRTPRQYFSESSIKYLSEQILSTRKLDPLYLDYANMYFGWPSHEGRHRAIVAEILKIPTVPVIVVKPTGFT